MWLSSWPNKRVGPQETKAELSQCRFFVGSIHFSCKTSTRVDRCFAVREGDSVFCSQKRGVVGLNDFYLMPKCCSSKESFFPLLGRLCSGRFYIFTEQMWFKRGFYRILAACFTLRGHDTCRFTAVIVFGREDLPSDASAFSLTSLEA